VGGALQKAGRLFPGHSEIHLQGNIGALLKGDVEILTFAKIETGLVEDLRRLGHQSRACSRGRKPMEGQVSQGQEPIASVDRLGHSPNTPDGGPASSLGAFVLDIVVDQGEVMD